MCLVQDLLLMYVQCWPMEATTALHRFKSCYHRCVKKFFGYSTLDSMTNILAFIWNFQALRYCDPCQSFYTVSVWMSIIVSYSTYIKLHFSVSCFFRHVSVCVCVSLFVLYVCDGPYSVLIFNEWMNEWNVCERTRVYISWC